MFPPTHTSWRVVMMRVDTRLPYPLFFFWLGWASEARRELGARGLSGEVP